MSQEVITVPVDELHAGENVRSQLAARCLIDSIAEIGVRVPLHVYRNPAGELTVLDGHRRLHAAKSAGLLGVPVIIVNEPSAESRILEQLVLNEAREGLSDADQVNAVQQLAFFNVDSDMVAKFTGKDKERVSRLAKVAASEHSRRITTDLALPLDYAAKIADAEAEGVDMKLLDQLLTDLMKSSDSDGAKLPSERAFDDVIRKARAEMFCQKKIAEFQAQGVTVLGRGDEIPESYVSLSALPIYEDEHESCEYRVIVVSPSWDPEHPWVSEFCSDPEAAGHRVPSEEDKKRAEIEQKEAEQSRILEQQKKEAEKYRRKFVTGVIASPPQNSEHAIYQLIILILLHHLYAEPLVSIFKELGLEAGFAEYFDDPGEYVSKLEKFAARNTPASYKTLLIVVFSIMETVFQRNYYGEKVIKQAYLKTLETLGYELTAWEQTIAHPDDEETVNQETGEITG